MLDTPLSTSDEDSLKAEIKRLSARALTLKMDLHDLAEDLPEGWPRLIDLAQKTFAAFELLERKRNELAKRSPHPKP